MALRNALHAEVNSWRAIDSSTNIDAGLLWQQVFDLEPRSRNAEVTNFNREASANAGKQKLVPLHVLATAARQA
jgi:hypothetical protein